MLQVSKIAEHKDEYIQALKKRNFEAEAVFNKILELDETRRSTQAQLDDTLSTSNKLSKEIGLMFKNGEHQKANVLKQKTGKLKEDSKDLSGVILNFKRINTRKMSQSVPEWARCMDCGAHFKDFLNPNVKETHDGVPRCEHCEKCYANDCPICLESVAPMAKNSCITECGHEFHLECLMRHKANSTSCPMCRNPLERERSEDFIRPSQDPEIHFQAEARIREEAYNDGYEQGLVERHHEPVDALRRRGDEYQRAYNILNDTVGYLEELTHEEIAEAAEQEGVYLPQPLTVAEQEEIEMMQLCEDISGDNDLPRFVFNTVNDLQTAVRELEGSRIREQAAYDSGVVDGRSIANEDIALLRAGKESLERQVDIINKELKLLREQLAKATPTKL